MLPQKDNLNHTDKATQATEKTFKINFKNCLATVGRHLENLILASAKLLSTWLHSTMKAVSKLRQKIRPGRSYIRRSFKPRRSWTAYGKANIA